MIKNVLTPVKPPTRGTTSISVEHNIHHVRVTDNRVPPVIVTWVKESGAIFIGDRDSITTWFKVKVCETDPNSVALRNTDFLDMVKVAKISLGVVRTGQNTTCCQLSFRG